VAFELFQGEDKTITVLTNIDLTSYTEIEFNIDTPTQIKKTKTGGGITGITASQFSVQIDAGDTETVPAGSYKFQARGTDSSSKKVNGKFQPNKLVVKDSIFVSQGSGKDYN